MKIGIVNGGSDCPGLNATIRAIVKTALSKEYNCEVVGYKDGYKGLVINNFIKLDSNSVSGILDKGGTILGTSNKYDPFHFANDKGEVADKGDNSDRVVQNMKMFGVDALIIIGGDVTLNIAKLLSEKGVNVVCIPKSSENEIPGTDTSIGFMSAVDNVTDAIDKLHSNAESNHRIMILEVMGQTTGWVALRAGMAGGADIILLPERPYELNKVARAIMDRKNMGKNFSIVVVADGSRAANSDSEMDAHESIGARLACDLETITGIEAQVTVLGQLQKGGRPNPYDRIVATRFGVAAVEMAVKGEYGSMVCMDDDAVSSIPLSDVVRKFNRIDMDCMLVKMARNMQVCFGD